MPGPRVQSPLNRELDRQGRSRRWMADRLGVGAWTYSRIEGRKQRVPDGWYERAAAHLGVNVLVVAASGYRTTPAADEPQKAAA